MAGRRARKLEVILAGDATGLEKALDASGRKLRKFGEGLTRAGKAGLMFSGAVGAGLISFAKQAEDAHLQEVKLDNTLANSTQLAGANRKAFIDLSKSIQSKTAADADEIVGMEALLGQYGATESQILTLTPLIVDMSRKMGIDLDAAAKAVGKTLNGNSGALARMGINIDKTALKTDAFGAVQDALASKVGGFAEQEGKTFSGQLQRLKNDLGDVAEGIGTGVIPVIENLIRPIRGATDAFGEMSPAAQRTVGSIATIGTIAVGSLSGLAMLAGGVIKLKGNLSDASGHLTKFGKAAVGVSGVATAAAIGFSVNAYYAAKNTEAIDALTDALMNNSDGWKDNANSVAGINPEMKTLLNSYRDAKLAGDANAGAIKEQILAHDDEFGILRKVVGAIDKRTDALSDSQKITEESAAAQKEYADLLASGETDEKKLAEARAKVVSTTKVQASVQDDVNEAVDEGTEAVDGLAESTDKAVVKIQDFIDRNRTLRNTLRDDRDSTFDVIDAEDALIEKMEALVTVQKTGEGGQRALAAAQRDAIRANDDLAASIDDKMNAALEEYALKTYGTKDAVLSATEKTDIFRWNIAYLQGQVQKGGPAWQALEDFKNQLLSVSSGGNMNVTVSRGGAMQSFHSGGVFRAPTPGGEGVALLKDRERIIPADAAGGMGGNVTINIHAGLGTDPRVLERTVTEALLRYAKSVGGVPLKLRTA